jgi:signal transduction histidine kinase
MRNASIRTRLTLWYSAVLTFALLVCSGTTWLLLRHFLYSDLSRTLLNQSLGFTTYLQIEDKHSLAQLAHESDEYSRSLPQRHLLTLLDPNGGVLYTNTPEKSPVVPNGSFARPGTPFPMGYQGAAYLAVCHSVWLKRGEFRTVLAIPTESTLRVVWLLGVVLCGVVPLFVVAGAVGGYWLSRRALTPVGAITAKARAIGLANLSERLPVLRTNDELQRLTETWNEMLDRLERSVSNITQFTGDASHELRTPIAIIRLAAENALRRGRPEAEYRLALEHVYRESENMTALVDNLLFLAHADTQRQRTSGVVELRCLTEAACVDLTPMARAKHIDIQHATPSSPMRVPGDQSTLGRLFRILLDNAIKYTPEGGSVRIDLQQEDDGFSARVVDTGIGIPEGVRDRVFERFFRVDPSRSKESGGYGLGLAIAFAIVKQHGGRITVEPNSPTGSIFWVWLPAAEAATNPTTSELMLYAGGCASRQLHPMSH